MMTGMATVVITIDGRWHAYDFDSGDVQISAKQILVSDDLDPTKYQLGRVDTDQTNGSRRFTLLGDDDEPLDVKFGDTFVSVRISATNG